MQARIAKAAASPKRLELIELLCQSPKTVEHLAQEAQISVKLTSAHLKELKAARPVEAERQGKYVIYRLASDDVARFCVTLRLLAEDRRFELQKAPGRGGVEQLTDCSVRVSEPLSAQDCPALGMSFIDAF